MSFVYDQKVVDSMYGSHVVSMAVDYGVDLVKMWPLQTNQELENDVKYAENLQVMFSGMMTQVLLKRSEEVDQSVAEAVYEGMDVLPGVDPEIIRTLMDSNRAYDVMASYHGVDGIELFMETARILDIDVETRIEKEIQDLMENLSRTMRSVSGFEVDDDVAENVGICQSATVDRNEFARRYLASMTVLDALINLMCYGTDDSQEQAIRVLPVLLFVNSMRNQLSIPPTFINAEQLINLFGLRDTARQFGRPQSVFDSSFNPLTFSTTVKYLAFFAGQEWLRHMRFLEWDPKQAEQDAKDEDERKSREALAKKYNLTSDGDNAASDADLDSSADSNLSEDSDSSEEAGSEPTEE